MITVGELFAGIGGFSLAFDAAGARTAWFVEREPYAQQVLKRHWPGVPVYGDIYGCHDLPYVDVITAGFPCQPFSVAGKRSGERDERYLVPEMLRIIGEVRPYVVLLENVPGFANIADGNTFKQLLWALADLGYDAQWGHLRASDAGAPHRRERWFCVAYAERSRFNWHTWRRAGAQSENGRASANMGHATSIRRERQRPTRKQQLSTPIRSAISGRTDTYSNRAIKPRLGRDAYGLSGRLDAHRWPARPGEPQHASEPPRTVSAQPHRTARLKALGNAVVPQIVYPIALAIVDYLETRGAQQSA